MADAVQFSKDPALFERAEALFQAIYPVLTKLVPSADIQHVGSTAIPGTLTKGDLDIVVRVQARDFLQADEAIAKRYARNTGSDRSDEFSAFMDTSTDPELGIQLVVIEGACDDFLAWRDLLKSDLALRREYDELKGKFHGKSMDAYRTAKSEFIKARLAA